MKHSLDRVLRVRRLLEDLSRLELQQRAAAKRQLEKGAQRQRRLALSVRGEALGILEGRAGEEAREWLLKIADADLFAWKGGKLDAMAEAERPMVEAARTAMLARRLDRRQMETLIAAAAAVEDKQGRRRVQSQVDEWFQSRTVRGRRTDQ